MNATNNQPIEDRLLFAVPKKGRLFEKVEKLLEGCGIEYDRPKRVDIAQCTSLPITIVFLPAADIAHFVGGGNVDLGITGEDIVSESGVDVEELVKLGIGKCQLAVQAPVCSQVCDPANLLGKRIVTSFPNSAERYFRGLAANHPEVQQADCKIKFVSGSVEAACALGLADAVVDLVETGTTMKAAGLEIVATIMQTEAVLIKNKHTQHTDLIEKIRQRIDGYITATRYVMLTYNVARENLAQAQAVCSGKKAPSVTSLDLEGWVAVTVVCEKKQVQTVMDALITVGADDLLVSEMACTRM